MHQCLQLEAQWTLKTITMEINGKCDILEIKKIKNQNKNGQSADITSNEDTDNLYVGLSDMAEDTNGAFDFQGDGADGIDAAPGASADPADPAGGNKKEVDVVMDMDVQVNVDMKYREVNGDKEDKNMDMKVDNNVEVNKEVDKKEDEEVDDEQM
eukprot:290510_1